MVCICTPCILVYGGNVCTQNFLENKKIKDKRKANPQNFILHCTGEKRAPIYFPTSRSFVHEIDTQAKQCSQKISEVESCFFPTFNFYPNFL